MYKLHLILKYLLRRRIAWVSLIGVMLCTAMVIVVLSVMGGWLRNFRESFHALSGDIIVEGRSLTGFPGYEEMLKRIRALPEVKAAAPVLRVWGLINIDNQIRKGVEVVGYPEEIQEINNFRRSCFLLGGNLEGYLVSTEQADGLIKAHGNGAYVHLREHPLAAPADAQNYAVIVANGMFKFDARGNELSRMYLNKPDSKPDPARASHVRVRALENEDGSLHKNNLGQISAMAITQADQVKFDLWPQIDYVPPKGYKGRDVHTWKGMVVGSGVIGLKKDSHGKIYNRDNYQYRVTCDLTVLPISPEKTGIDLSSAARNFYWLIDDSRTGVHLIDTNTVYVPFSTLQKDLEMDAQENRPARTSSIQIKLKDGYDASAMKPAIEKIVFEVLGINSRYPVQVQTWKEQHAMFLDAVENEKGIVTIIMGVISIVAILLILCIFYMIVKEKTRDIGIIKSLGAPSSGVAAIFLGYGAAIGVVGGLLGLLAGGLFVHYINEVHALLGKMGWVVWKPEVYLFDTIPNQLIPRDTALVVAVAILSAIVGALYPAVRAARMPPVEALRWE